MILIKFVVLCFVVFLCASPSSELVVFDPGKWLYRTRSEGLTGYSCLSVLLPLRVRHGHLSWNNSSGSATLLRWPDHPSACLLLKSPTLVVRNNPEPLGLSGWCYHWCLSLLLCPVSYNTVLLGDVQVDQLIEAISPDSVETFPQLGVETPAEAVSLLFIGISMISCVLAQVIEGLSILQCRAGSLIECQKFIQLAIKNSSWDMVSSESSLEFLPRHFMISR
jgi:hypothetical protein